MKEYFSIGELAELFGLNIQTLHYYDSAGIFSPRECNKKNGCRKYKFDQIYGLATASHMRRLGYSLEEIKEPRISLNSNRVMDIVKQCSRELRRQWQELLNIDEAIQRKIRLMEQEMDRICLDEIAVKHSEDWKFISIGDEELLYRENPFYFYPTIAFYEEDRKYLGACLYPDDEELPKTVPQSRIRIIPEGDFLCGYHLGGYEGIPDTIRRLRGARPDLELGAQAINFNVLDQFVESDNENFIIVMQVRVLQIHITDDAVHMRKHEKSKEKGRVRIMKSRMRLAAVVLALSMVGFGLTGCSGQVKETEAKTGAIDKQAGSAQTGDTQEKGDQADDGQAKEGQTADGRTYKVALCLPGAANDMGWRQSAYGGLKLLEAGYGCEVTYTENLTPDDVEAAFVDYAASGYDVVIGHGYEFGDLAAGVAEQYSDTKSAVVEGEASADNVAFYVSKCEEDGYITGTLVTGTSESGKVGFIGLTQGASLAKIINGFKGEAEEASLDIQIQTAWTGPFTDTALGKEAAQAMIDNGMDITGHYANESGTGVINAAKEAKVYTTGNSHDQNDLVPDTILPSSVYHIPYVIEVVFETAVDGILEGGIYQLGMADGTVSVAPYHNLDSTVPDELKQKISGKVAAIESGEFEVSCDTKPRI